VEHEGVSRPEQAGLWHELKRRIARQIVRWLVAEDD
jgi:outer membrane lipopolysaccharide assembly protein LptE/RlpB